MLIGRMRGNGDNMREEFRAELDQVAHTLVTMAERVRDAMRCANQALLTADRAAAEQVIDRDAEIDAYHRIVEDRVYDLVARQQPVELMR